jgi:hypothetical protein
MALTQEQLNYIRQNRMALERRALFTPCMTKEHLQAWIKRFLGIELPDVTVCDDDVTTSPSNSNPMDLIWEVYAKAMEGTDENFQRFLAFAARDSFKTLSASILEVLCLFHLRRDVAHMAAIESQAQKAASYVAKYLQRRVLKDFVKGSNKREITILRYEDSAGNVLTEDEFKILGADAQLNYEPISHYLKIIIATLAGANSEHVSFMVLDELDLAPEGPVEEAKMIPAPGQVRHELPITFMTSTRKTSIGLVQKEIDQHYKDPKKNKLQIRHWNIIDVAQACPPTRHLPAEPKIPIYYSERLLRAISKDEYELLSTEEQKQYYEKEGYAGCLRNCALFAVCRGRLATKQTSASPMLKPVTHVQTQFGAVSVEHAKAQLLCWKPSSEGLIYPNFSHSKHMLDPAAMYEKITGEELSKESRRNFTKADLIKVMIERGMDFHTGMDFGFTHNWACITGARDGHRLFVFDVIAVAGLELMQKIDMAKERLLWLDPTVYPDPAYPADIKTFRRHGFRCKNFVKDVLGGIESVRAKLMPGLNREPEIYFLATDPGCELLAERIAQYHWVLDANQKPTDVPNDKDDDECDALRYLCQNLFGVKGRFTASVHPVTQEDARPQQQQQNPNNWMTLEIQKRTGDGGSGTDEQHGARGKRGGFIFDV